MTSADVYDPRLKPGRRSLMQWIALRDGGSHCRRAERLQIRALQRGWSERSIEQLLGQLLARAEAAEATLFGGARSYRRHRHFDSLARANGWGSAGQCPVALATTTPAAQAGVPLLAPVTGPRPAGGGVV